MEKTSSFISKKVISLADANQVGYVLNVVFDDKIKIFTGLIVIDEESENSFILHKRDIVAVGEDCIMIKDVNVLEFYISSLSNNPIGKMVYDCHGNMLGRVIEVETIGKVVKKIITDKCEFPQRFVRKSGDNFIIFGNPVKETKKKNFKEVINNNNLENMPKVVINVIPNQNDNKIDLTPEFPIRLYAGTKNLIGKKINSDLLGYNNEIICHKNQKINQKIINKAISHNKLNLLKFYSE